MRDNKAEKRRKLEETDDAENYGTDRRAEITEQTDAQKLRNLFTAAGIIVAYRYNGAWPLTVYVDGGWSPNACHRTRPR